MKKIYITVLLVFIASLLLFIFSFVYLDKYNHKTFYYNIAIEGQYAGTAKIDKYVTEERLIYKSASAMPFRELFTDERSRLDLDRRYNLLEYQKELFANGASHLYYAEANDASVSFMSRLTSQFTFISNVPVRRGAFIFEESSPLTYLPIIENYDFKLGGAQGFNSIIYLPDSQTPPLRRFVTLTSVRDEYIKIGRRKIKTEMLLLKIKSMPPGSVWVAKSDRTLIMIDIPSIGLKITRGFEPKELKPREPSVTAEEYLSKDVVFPGKAGQLSGTFTVPKDTSSQTNPAGKHPAVLLIWGSGPHDRSYQGLFESIASYLPRYGYCVLRFDRRGVGLSGGDAATAAPDDDLADLASAVSFLKSQNEVNANRIAVISHAEGALSAMRLAAQNADIKGLVLMSPIMNAGLKERETLLRDRAALEKWNEEYLKTAMRALQETYDKANKTGRDWGYILGKKCYLKAARNLDAIDPAQAMAKISAPIAILHGRKETQAPTAYIVHFDKALAAYGKMKHSIIYFETLGNFFGKLGCDGSSRMRYLVDREALAAIRDWLNLNTAELAGPEDIRLNKQ